MRKVQNIKEFEVMAKKCGTCPFGPNGDQKTRQIVEARALQVSQTCHSTGAIRGKPDTKLCRGSRDFQIQIMHRLGVIKEATDEAWDAVRKELDV